MPVAGVAAEGVPAAVEGVPDAQEGMPDAAEGVAVGMDIRYGT